MLHNLICMERYTGFNPIVHGDDRVLILGSMPSIQSIEKNMYYANPSNRFWPMLGYMYSMPYQTREEKLKILDVNKIALWDICHSCIRHKSSDASIQDIVVNDIDLLLEKNPTIQIVLCNGKTSYLTFKKYYPQLEAICCPSTSSANARFRLADLIKEYKGAGL